MTWILQKKTTTHLQQVLIKCSLDIGTMTGGGAMDETDMIPALRVSHLPRINLLEKEKKAQNPLICSPNFSLFVTVYLKQENDKNSNNFY